MHLYLYTHTHVCMYVCIYERHMFWTKSLVFWLCLILVTTAEMKASEVQGWFLTRSL